MIAVNSDAIMAAIVRTRQTMERLRQQRPVPTALLAILALEELRLLREDCGRRRN